MKTVRKILVNCSIDILLNLFWAPLSVFRSRFFVPLRSTKRAPLKPGRVQFGVKIILR